MPVATTKGFSYLLDPEYRKIFYDEFTGLSEEFSKIANVSSVDKGDRISEAALSGLGNARLINQGESVQFDSHEQGRAKTVYFDKYGLGFQVTEEMYEDDLTGLMKKMPQQLGASLAYARETVFFDLLNRGATAHRSADGQYLFATGHTLLKSASTWANMPSSASALSETSLEAALDTIEGWVNDSDRPVHFEPRLLLVPTGLRWMARILLKSDGRPRTADNDINPLIEEGLNYMVGHYLTSTTAWYVVCKTHDLRFVWRRNAKFASSDDFVSGNALFKGTMRLLVGAWDARGVYQNVGA